MIMTWMNDPSFVRLVFIAPSPWQSQPTQDDIDAYFDRLCYTYDSFAIIANGNHVGNIGLKNGDSLTREAEFFIEIGSEKDRGKGYGKAAMRLLLEHAFDVKRLRKLNLSVLEFNDRAKRLYERVGFQHTGTSGYSFDDGTWYKVLRMELTSEAANVQPLAVSL